MEGLCRFNTWCRRNADRRFRSHSVTKRTKLATHPTNGLPVFSKFHRTSWADGRTKARRANIRDSRLRVAFHQLWNPRDAHLATPGNLPGSLSARPGAGEPRADSPRYEHGRSMAGLGNTRAKDPRPDAQFRDVGLRALRHAFSKLRRALLLRSIRLVVHPAEVPLSIQRGYFLQGQSCFLPILAAAATIKLANNFVRIPPRNESV